MAHKVGALKNMSNAVESELSSLLTYYGEDPDSPETPKPEDFFGLIVSFSSSLQVGMPFESTATNSEEWVH